MTDVFAPEFLGRSFWASMPEVAVIAGINAALKDGKYDFVRTKLGTSAIEGMIGTAITNKIPAADFLELMRAPSANPDPTKRIAAAFGLTDISDLIMLHNLQDANQVARRLSYYDTAESFYYAEKSAREILSVASLAQGFSRRVLINLSSKNPEKYAKDTDETVLLRGIATVDAIEKTLLSRGIHSNRASLTCAVLTGL